MKKNDLLYVDHILDTSSMVGSYTKDISLEEFIKNSMIYDAVVRNLQILAESTQKISKSTKDKYKSIPWGKIAGLRNILVHDYINGIDAERIWNIVTSMLPTLSEAFSKIRSELEEFQQNGKA